jgi:hypothetical protein
MYLYTHTAEDQLTLVPERAEMPKRPRQFVIETRRDHRLGYSVESGTGMVVSR